MHISISTTNFDIWFILSSIAKSCWVSFHKRSSGLHEVVEFAGWGLVGSLGLVSHFSGDVENELNGFLVRQTLAQRQSLLGLVEDLEELLFSIVPSVLDSLLVVLDLLVELLQILVVELVGEELQRVLVVGAELVVPVELISHSSFLNYR